MEQSHARSSGDAPTADANIAGAAAVSNAPFLDRDVACVRCSYNLRGLPASGNCPECGEPIANSIKGFMLQDASAEYRGKLKLGLSLVLNGILALVLLGLLGSGAQFAARVTGTSVPWLDLALELAGALVTMVLILGYWRFSEADPGFVSMEQPAAARRVLRVTVVLAAALALIDFIAKLSSGSLTGGMNPAGSTTSLVILGLLMLLGLALWVVQFVVTMTYTAWIGGRVPDEFVVRRAKMYRWLLPVIYVVGAIIVIGPRIALVMYWNLLDRVRKHLKSIEATGMAAELPGRLG